ncbi:MAG: HD-GYP domain-containing protein [Phycisphaerae bacterium]
MRAGEIRFSAWPIIRSVLLFMIGTILCLGLIARSSDSTEMIFSASLIVLFAGLAGLRIHQSLRDMVRRSELISIGARQAEGHYVDVLRRIVLSGEAREEYHYGHSANVARLARRIGEKMGLSARHCDRLELAGELHDIGMLSVPEEILRGRGPISVQKYHRVQQHANVGYEILQPLPSLADILPAVRSHHERMNGTGYPDGLRGEDIPLDARILAVADSYEAMTHDRPHRAAMTSLAAMDELERCTPAGYDPEVVEALAQVINLSGLQEAMTPAMVGA